MKATCIWTPWEPIYEHTGTYDTECGQAHSFIEGSIYENDYLFCPYCGKPIEDDTE